MADNKKFADYLRQLQEAQFPRWADLPQFDLYMDQVIQYVNDIVSPLGFGEITSTMVNNYVKKGVIKAPIKKKYHPEQLANILVIAMLKPVFALDMIAKGIRFAKEDRPVAQAYDTFILTFVSAIEQANSDFNDALTINRVNKPDTTATQHAVVTLAINAVLQKLMVEKMLELEETPAPKEGKKA
ncbi:MULTISPECIES: DUF1836 domain-containing protein [Lacticaseibacillus]|uniref:DUF1836 domain-containing protein n=4 Tax=Lacticaseibacillus TaxID=2759736 RepID=A0AAN1C807_LACCA|nr:MULTISPECIES: DUF1836 domain-containing protein [Lacticaseibacillus]OFR95325.1 hypothetical protein HMPREF2861_09570 [Lactobacillus sp. HMSC068F07]ARY91448.1 hypothetical protein BGL52_06665 [Lacticaseibacillus casei]KAB1968556.1 DUF1836 domain-containing protein [Lacticaseibacillus casei]KLI76422.1 hypothetical protein AAW28_04405 [Lacticaseibacillus casei]MBI6597518.1 DUF1836 domain-containing protein [Lacticaseibacillus casei]